MFKCDVCGKDTDKVLLNIGACCPGDCEKQLVEEYNLYHRELLTERLDDIPETFETHDFERFTLKYAIHALEVMSKKTRDKIERNNPMISIPENFALHVKEQVLNFLPAEAVHQVDSVGHVRMFSGGEYSFVKTIDKDIIIDAFYQAGLLERSQKSVV